MQHSFSAGMQRGRTLDLSGMDASATSQDGTFLRNSGGSSETFNAAFDSGILTEVLTPGRWIFRNSVLWLCRKDNVQGKQQLSIQIFHLQEIE